ncbi:hypothetical protein [Pseudoduganella namucuonensis]|uniref:Uncharacterized protein n=1 Tax=Pseudoduganella namucuonensis TaxID=1035707 RepID=A0A1I7K8I3_9BURK|nr:hypothetical protein [Pseudoduganella namucuonensis]SFU93763.1 hypothetical protein SAMN05216552_101596 [Pseudoduganella namucuonensis]
MRMLPAITLLVCAAAARAETRQATPDEIKSFAAFLKQAGGADLKPVFDIRRDEGAREWRVAAWAETRPQRGAWRLCLARRTPYAYDGGRWSASGGEARHAWLDRASDCGVSPERVELRSEIGDRDIVTVLERQGQVLQGARLLFAGNTQCAPIRAHKFKLAAVGMGADGYYRFTYRGERGGDAVVSVRKRGRELTAWNVRCET